jgi:hypothetical protein
VTAVAGAPFAAGPASTLHNGLMAFRLPAPETLIDTAVSTAGGAVALATAVASAPGRLLRLLDEGEVLLVRIARGARKRRSVAVTCGVVRRAPSGHGEDLAP